ncbi:ABC transporter ATP-binding protein [Halopiger goleimassiliensis]|uniref:ABC transporter ATP-binding protein n=1 Tax=Halopiger goleimassiliensis TaxID=1293048 RepID=UPI00067807CB|nr:ABC transporter ATP-binding protein [Halopiger goleimassiliensis]
MAILEARDVETGYEDAKIIHGVDVDVYADELVTLIGPNGAGKSTLLKALFGMIECWDGTVVFNGEDITNLEPHRVTRKGICYVPQVDNIFPSLTVYENLRMGAYILDDVPEAALHDVYDRFPVLEERKNQVAGTLSGGQRQMLAMGRGLMVDPDLLFIDEPSAGLAPELVDDVFEKIVEIRDDGTAVLFVEQNARKALQVSDRGYVLEMGRNQFEGTGDELLENEQVEELYLGG